MPRNPERKTAVKPERNKFVVCRRQQQEGVAILWILATIIAFSVLGAAIVATYNVSLFGQVDTSLASRAENAAESGYRFLYSEYQGQSSDVDKNKLLDEIRFVDDATGKLFNMAPDGGGQFKLDLTSYFYRVNTDHSAGPSLALKFIGNAGFSVPADEYLKIGTDETYYQYSGSPTESNGIYTFTVSPDIPATDDYTTVRQVVQTNIGSDVNDGGTLTLGSGFGALFPPENGMFLITKKKIKDGLPVKTIVPYRYEYRNGDQLMNIRKGPDQSSFTTIDSGSILIEIAKLLKTDITGFAPDKSSALASEINNYQVSLDIAESSPGLKSYWSFDDTVDPGKDDYGTSDGTPAGEESQVEGKVGKALKFGTEETSYVTTTFNPRTALGSNQPYTVVFWANPDDVESPGLVLGSWNSATVRYFFVGVNQSKWVWAFGNDWQTTTTVAYPLPDATASQWQHVAFVYDGSDVVFYINGIEKYRRPYGGEGIFPDLYIDLGAVYDQTDDHLYRFEGTLDEIAIFNRELDICEIREIHDVPCNVGCGTFNTANDPGVDPVVYYPFNCDENDDNQSNCSAGIAVDESGTAKDGNPPDDNNGTVTDAVLAADRFGCDDKAYSFDGSSAKIDVPHSDSLEMSDVDKVTVAAWVKKEVSYDLVEWKAILQKSDDSYNLQLNYGKPVFTIHDTNTHHHASSADTMTAGVWYHLVGTFDGSDVKIYVDGQLKDTTSITTANTIADASDQNVGIGYNTEISGRYFQGQIDDISIWERDLTLSEIQDYYNQTSHK